ncbi:MAG: hypothetical protein N4A49_01260 [Marinifilaceae bacterium]|jgi:hypothetical protein|nr:hypothetical protein [Marinifilaceae bacterium]
MCIRIFYYILIASTIFISSCASRNCINNTKQNKKSANIKRVYLEDLFSPKEIKKLDYFIQTDNPNWNRIKLCKNIQIEEAWSRLRDFIIAEYCLEILSKQDGLIKSSWSFDRKGKINAEYQFRITTKINKENWELLFIAEAKLYNGANWLNGIDSELTKELEKNLICSINNFKN